MTVQPNTSSIEVAFQLGQDADSRMTHRISRTTPLSEYCEALARKMSDRLAFKTDVIVIKPGSYDTAASLGLVNGAIIYAYQPGWTGFEHPAANARSAMDNYYAPI